MFHRVRSETPNKDEEQTTPEAVEEKVDAVESDTVEEDSAPEEEATEEEQKDGFASRSPYTRPSGARPSSYPGSGGAYSGPSSYNSPKSSAPSQQQPKPAPKEKAKIGERELTIGAGITMSGEIESCDNLIVEGTVEAALKGASNLEIAQSGTFFGSVDIQDATIAGRFEGEITVHGRLVLKSGGVITGTIMYGELEIEAGALVEGRLTPIAAGQRDQLPASSAGQGAAQQQVARVGNASQTKPANGDTRLMAAEA